MGGLVGRSIRSLKAEKAVKLQRLKSAWVSAVGEAVGSQSEPVKLSDKTLIVKVSSPVWAQEITLQQKLILKNLRGLLPDAPNKLRCWVGQTEGARPRRADSATRQEESVPWKDVQIPADRQAKIDQNLAQMKDETTREKLRGLMELSVKRELYLLQQGLLPCPICAKFRSPEKEICSNCERERAEHLERKSLQLLAREPWLSAQEFMQKSPVRNQFEFMKLRKKLLANLMQSLWQRTQGMDSEEVKKSMDDELRALMIDVTMLRCSLPMHSLSPRHFYHALGKRLAQGYLDSD